MDGIREIRLTGGESHFFKSLNEKTDPIRIVPGVLPTQGSLGREVGRLFEFGNLVRHKLEPITQPNIENLANKDSATFGALFEHFLPNVNRKVSRHDFRSLLFDGGKHLALFCQDGTESAMMTSWLYGNRTPRDSKDHAHLIELAINELGAAEDVDRITNTVTSKAEFVRTLAQISHEAFMNTHEHGLWESDGKRVNNPFRVLSIRFDRVNFSSLSGEVDPELVFFLNASRSRQISSDRVLSLRTEARNDKTIPILELSIIDNGPGIVSAFSPYVPSLDLPMPDAVLDKERLIVETAVRKHFTSKNQLNAGIGLFSVVSNLNRLGALLVLRTGRVKLYKDFANNPWDGVSHNNFFSISSLLLREHNDVLSKLQMAGTQITAFVPLIPLTATYRANA